MHQINLMIGLSQFALDIVVITHAEYLKAHLTLIRNLTFKYL
jgi:hypothetical protein